MWTLYRAAAAAATAILTSVTHTNEIASANENKITIWLREFIEPIINYIFYLFMHTACLSNLLIKTAPHTHTHMLVRHHEANVRLHLFIYLSLCDWQSAANPAILLYSNVSNFIHFLRMSRFAFGSIPRIMLSLLLYGSGQTSLCKYFNGFASQRCVCLLGLISSKQFSDEIGQKKICIQ